MKKVYICSRYRGDEKHSIQNNVERALFACSVALNKGYAPIAPHLIYPRCLNDEDPVDRDTGLQAARAWITVCDELWQWGASMSEGMAQEIAIATEAGIPVKVFNSIGIPQHLWNSEKLKREVHP